MNKLAELRARLEELNTKMRAMLDENDAGLSNELKKEYDKLDREYDQTEEAVVRLEKAEKRNNDMNTFQRAPLTGSVEAEKNESEKSGEYRDAFWLAQTRQPLSEAATRALSSGTAEKGGYLIPEEFSTKIVETLTEKSYMRGLATVSTSSSTENIPVEGDDGANGWIEEGGSYPESDPTIGREVMKAYKTGRILKVPEELLQDSFTSIESYIAKKFSKSTIKAEESAFVNGDGVGKPTGFLQNAAVGKTAAASDAITADEIVDLWGDLDEDYEADSVFMMNKKTLISIMKLKDGNGDYLVNKGLEGAPSTLLGRPIVLNKHMPDIDVDSKPIAVGDFSYYFIKDRKAMTMKRLDEKYADTGHIGFRVDKRVDGKLVIPDAVKVLKMAAA
jgi:HK97 family phage major capsid protein